MHGLHAGSLTYLRFRTLITQQELVSGKRRLPGSEFCSLSSPLFRCKLSRMNRPFLSVCTFAVTVASLFMIGQSLAQNAVSGDGQPEGVALTELSRPSYPPLARQTRISGDVDLMLRIRQDGSIESMAVISGHPLLAPTALASAQKSRYECKKCSETETSLRLVYTFQLVGPNSCCTATEDGPQKSQPGKRIPRVIQSLNHVTVVDQPACICDPAFDVRYKVRSAKCLYLWRCGTPRLRIYE
jgi:hypothetical protein